MGIGLIHGIKGPNLGTAHMECIERHGTRLLARSQIFTPSSTYPPNEKNNYDVSERHIQSGVKLLRVHVIFGKPHVELRFVATATLTRMQMVPEGQLLYTARWLKPC